MQLKLSDLISPTTPAGTALFLKWNDYHVFSIPKREFDRSPSCVRFFGVGGKRVNASESFVSCALRESIEEIGDVIASLHSAERTYLYRANETIQEIYLMVAGIRPRMIMEKRNHTGCGSMTDPNVAYYLVVFDATLAAKPKPSQEIAAIVYLTDHHLSLMHSGKPMPMAELTAMGAKIDCQPGSVLDCAIDLVPFGTAKFLIQQQFIRSVERSSGNLSDLCDT
ncbi:hypothetical protein C7B61_02575 [filamentous cyanobacterium CCP1]|nr:hypothetical protein C7B61_02575 [filamentous cyanobacterium CCP1]